MARNRTVDFLPPIFQTETNKQFLSATLDQLVQEPKFKKSEGFVGRRIGPGVNPNDKYVIELNATRANYQLEPGVVSIVPDTNEISDAITYPGIIDALNLQGAVVSQADRLFTSQYYTWDPFVDFDKFVNFSQYYWLPAGPQPVDVFGTAIPIIDEFDVAIVNNDYTFQGVPGLDPAVTLVRGGSYTFVMNQNSKFWIQAEPGVSGVMSWAPNISSRDVMGVVDNGTSMGVTTFNVPQRNAQQFYYNLTSINNVDLICDLKFSDINNVYLSEFLKRFDGIDGITNLNNRTLVFSNPDSSVEGGGWYKTTPFDPLAEASTNNGLPGSYDSILFDQVTDVPENQKYGLWQIQYKYNNAEGLGDPMLVLQYISSVDNLVKFNVLFGTQWSNTSWYKNAEGYYQVIPLLTAVQDVLWYQDGTNPEIFGRIRLIEQDQIETLNITEDIIGKKTYASPNGVQFTNNMIVQFEGSVTPSSYLGKKYYVAGVGSAIQLLPVTQYITPETYTKSASIPYDTTGYDNGNYDADLNQPLIPDYITMALNSPDRNAWARSNRWFHIDVINASASYNNTVAVLNNNQRAKRPILEFRGGTRLYNMGTEAKDPVDIIDFNETDAFSNINGTIGYSVDGYPLVTGSRVIFAADIDPNVRDKIYIVNFISPSSDGSTILEPIIDLVPASDADVLYDQTVVCTSGNTLQGKTFWYDGINWHGAQEKTGINQPPLFNIYDSEGVSIGDRVKYISSTFEGSKLFSYAVGTGTEDAVLGFPLTYLSLNNVGDIVFTNNLYVDKFIYVNNKTSFEENVSIGFVRQYTDRTIFDREIGWQVAATPSNTYQQFRFAYQVDTPLTLDILTVTQSVVPSIKLFVGTKFMDPAYYSVELSPSTNQTIITLGPNIVAVDGDIIEVLALSDQPSSVGFYQVPINLENNPLNQDPSLFTLGTVRTHFETIAQNLINFQGTINGSNNIRDLGDVVPYGLNILQQSSPLTMAGYFLRKQEYQIFKSMEYSSREYEKFKAQFLNTAITNDYYGMSIADILTSVIAEITSGKTSDNPFYWSDMLPAGSVYTETVDTITPISNNTFDTVQVYDFTSANFKALLVYLNDILLTLNSDYIVSPDAPTLTIELPLAVGDVVKIQEFTSTAGSFVPNTPTKMGLYPAFKPEVFVDETYTTPQTVIRGHDGSITIAFDDFRTDLLLEFETRIYNNLKLEGNPVPLTADQVIPGQFRTTDYTMSEVNNILSQDFLSWVGWNKLDYKLQIYQPGNEFTYNYSTASNKLDPGTPLSIGAWRGLYNYFYDTIYPNTRPWEMLGFSQEPIWWEESYGPAPYTSGNLVLWDDLQAGIVRDPVGSYVLPEFVRPQLTEVIPAGSEGQLLSPLTTLAGAYDALDFRKSWVVGDDGPVENTWRTSSAYPFAIMRLLALTRPAEFFSLFADRDVYKYDVELGQYLDNKRYRLDATGVQVYGDGVSKASFINWIVDYNRLTGINSTAALTADLKNLDVRLCYRMAAFTGKNLVQLYTEKSSPNSLNSSLLLPDESYKLLFYKNVPFGKLTYSSVIIQSAPDGYAVYGYSTTNPYFDILQSRVLGLTATISAGGSTVTVPIEYTNNVVQVPYGYVFPTINVLADFLLSYGQLLQTQGMIFDSVENGYIIDWNQMVSEFLYWANQGWEVGSVINLNPAATKISVQKDLAIVDSIALQTVENMVLDQNRQQLSTRDLIINRNENTFTVESVTGQTINYLNLNFVSYENMIVLDNRSIFADLIYNPATGARQNRIKIFATVSAEWNGQLDAPGFILNQNNIESWKPYRKYTRGEIVKYKNFYYSAITLVQPSAEFNFDYWTRSDYTQIQQGLLANLPNKSDQLANSYNVFSANLEEDQDLLSYGLIGFRPRQYMSALNLSDTTQVNLYRQFIGTKGTVQAAELFTFADLGRGVAQYDIYENWGVQRAVYGANANRSYYEIQLNEAKLQSNPSLIQVVLPEQQSNADQTVLLDNLWKESYNITSPEILTTIYPDITDTAFPSAGYADFDDVDITVFDITSPNELNAKIDVIGHGTTIWAAKVNEYDWNVYRSVKVSGLIIRVNANLDGTCLVTFNAAHGLSNNSIVIIKNFDSTINGSYLVLSIINIYQITIAAALPNNQLIVTGTGIAYKLQTQRVTQSSDILNLPYAKDLLPGAKVWVDNNGQGHWKVVEKQEVFTGVNTIAPNDPIKNTGFGSSIAQGTDNLYAIVGAPTYSTTGGVYTYVKTNTTALEENSFIVTTAVETSSYGFSVTAGGQHWMAVGAPTSANNRGYVTPIYRDTGSAIFDINGFFTIPDIRALQYPAEFGYSVAMSSDENWLYIGAPGVNTVYAYGRVDIDDQKIGYFTNGQNYSFNYSNYIVVDQPPTLAFASNLQLVVLLNNQLLKLGVDYTLDGNDVTLTSVPPADLYLSIARRTTTSLDRGDYRGITGTTVGSGSAATFNVVNQRGEYSATIANAGTGYAVGTTITILGTTLQNFGTTATTPANDLQITVASVVGGGATGPIESITILGSGIGNTNSFSLDEWFYSVTNIYSFEVFVNGIQQRPNIDFEFDQDYSTLEKGRTLIFVSTPAAGDIIDVTARSYFTYVNQIQAPTTLPDNARFGHSLSCTTDGRQIMIGCPDTTYNLKEEAGTVYVFDRYVQRFIISDVTQTTYTVSNGQLLAPTFVLLNNQFLVNKAGRITGTFSVSTIGMDDVVTLDTTLNVGDLLEIESNQFNLLQTINSHNYGTLDNYGSAIDSCNNNCSLYIGAPNATLRTNTGGTLMLAGYVERRVNKSRVYGTTTSGDASQTLVPGDTIRINNQVVVLTTPETWNYAEWAQRTVVTNSGYLYRAIRYVPPGIEITDTTYWQLANWSAQLVNDINDTAIPNVTAIWFPYGTAIDGRMTIAISNPAAAPGNNKLSVLPGLIGTIFDDLAFDTFAYTQTIYSPVPQEYSNFGSVVNIDTSANTLTVSAPNGTAILPTTFDFGDTYFDTRSTRFTAPIKQSGVAYTYDYLPSSDDTINNTGKFVFGQQIYSEDSMSLDQFGTALDYTHGILLVGVPGYDAGDSTLSELNYGRLSVFNNLTNTPAWTTIREQKPVVDIKLINSVYTYNAITSATTEFFDFIDPLQGKILGAARQNINYFGAIDPAQYNVGSVNNNGQRWGAGHVGEIWWDTNNVRFVNPNQNDVVYASRRWSQVFPGSSVDVYQWVESPVPPTAWTTLNLGGTPKDIVSYDISSQINAQGLFTTSYFFWVKGINSVATGAGKTLSVTSIAQYIENPRSSGIPYVAFINASTTALYNTVDLISAQDTILNIEFDRQLNDDNVHVQYELIPEYREDGFLSAGLYRKLQDSFCGADTVGNKVPDINLSPANRYGVQFRPRQSMFLDRYTALQNYLEYVNAILAQYPIVESRQFALLNSREVEPSSTSGEWNKRVANIEELSYQNFKAVPVGYKYLVISNSLQNGLWTIYEVTTAQTFESLLLVRIQNYDTRRYWSHIDWYAPTITPGNTQVVLEVVNYSALDTISVPFGSIVQVHANAQGKWEWYVYGYISIDTGAVVYNWQRVALQDGTIAFSDVLWNYQLGRFGFDVEVFDAQYFDQEPVIETRKIIQSINEELLIDDLAIERNRALVLMFNYVLTEFKAPEWLVKTSLIDVTHRIRSLVPYQIYQQDNQDFVVNYIKEVKPYHVQIREINLIYDGFDVFQGTMTDFDVPSYYNTDLVTPAYTSPILTPYTYSTAVGTGKPSYLSDAAPDSAIWSTMPWNAWYQNYLLEISSVEVIDGGYGYSIPPVVTVVGDSITPAIMTAQINSAGKVIGIIVIDPGTGYSSTAQIELTGGDGHGARAIARMYNNLVRNINTTIKFDRYQYNSDIVTWTENVAYNSGTQVRFDDIVWSADNNVAAATEFDPQYWTVVPATDLSGVDRTTGYYVPAVNEPGLDLPLLIDGIDYPGVQVSAPGFNQDTGYDVGNFDINPFDNISYGPEGKPTYDPAILDAIYEGSFLDPYLGTRTYDVNVEGGEFIDTYSSHAPEELVPGSEFDTLDFRVYTRPGSDWDNNGHGFVWKINKWTYNSITATSLSYDNLITNPVQVRLANQTQQRELTLNIDYIVDWANTTVNVITNSGSEAANDGDVLIVSVFGIGGGSQLFKDGYNGSDLIDHDSVVVPVAISEIQDVVIFVDGTQQFGYTLVSEGLGTTITFAQAYLDTDYINITIMGYITPTQYSWSTPITQTWLSDGRLDYSIDAYMGGTNSVNMIVDLNGIRARPPESVEYVADGSLAYLLPTRGGYPQGLIADNDVQVWINNVPQVLYVDFRLENLPVADDREVILTTLPGAGDIILISVWTKADYTLQSDGSSLYSNQLVFRTDTGFYPQLGDLITVTTWNDTSQQEILTLVFQGPVTSGVAINEPYDSTDFDLATVPNTIGSYDYTEGLVETKNDFQLGRPVLDPTRLWVTKNGQQKFYGIDFLISGEELVLAGPAISATDVVVIEQFTDSIVPEELDLRIFQDMRGVQATYRITPSTTTYLVQPLSQTDDVIYLNDVGTLAQPNLTINVWGLIIVGSERIMYRDYDADTNTVSSLRRGTAGTSICDHSVDSLVYNVNADNLLYPEYQDHYVSNYALGDGATTTFVANDINLVTPTKVGFVMANTIQVYVGGILQTSGYTVTSIAPATVVFDTAPTEGYQVTIQVRQSQSWYTTGIYPNPSNGNALQTQLTLAGQFFRGQ